MSKPFFMSRVMMSNITLILTVIVTALNALVQVIPPPYDQIGTPLVAAIVAGLNLYLRYQDTDKPISLT